MVHAFVLIDAVPSRVADLAVELADVAGVAEVSDADHENLADVVTRHIHQLEGITDTRTLIAFRAYSRHDLEAMWDLGGGN
jgi:DNA-binding Lrp family transcriptional regulator